MQLKKIVEPFGEVNVYPAAGGGMRVVATILMEPHKEGAQTGIALDGSGSMAKLYGVDNGSRVLSPIFGGPKKLHNDVTPIAQKICAYLARRIDADGGTTCIYWAVSDNGSKIEVVGDLRADEAERHIFGPPREFGTGTQLLPAVKYFVERFKDAPWGFFVFITDGELHDLDAVKDYSARLARDVSARRRNPLKFVLIGIGPDVNEAQMVELDDLDAGVDVDLWDHKLAAEMRMLEEIFAEVVDKNARIADNGRIRDAQGRVVRNYSDTGMPAYLEFEMPAGSEYFTLEVNGSVIHQGLSDHASVPASQTAVADTLPLTEEIPEVLPVTPPVPQKQTPAPPKAAAPAPSQHAAPPKPASASKSPSPAKKEDDADAEWRGINLEFAPKSDDEPPDVGLEKTKNE
jgi:hypothetical protein